MTTATLDRPTFTRQDVTLPGDQPFNLSTLVVMPATMNCPAVRVAAYRFDGHLTLGMAELAGWFYRGHGPPEAFKLPLMGNEDPRLVRVGGEMYMVTTFNPAFRIEVRHVLIRHCECAQLGEPARINTIRNFPGGYTWRWEKNWIPFDCDGKFYFVYSVGPEHRIVRLNDFDEQDADAEMIHSTPWECPWPAEWIGSGLRGGGPALKLPGRDSYLASGHSFAPGKGYYTFLYTFSAKPPFAVESFSRAPLFTPDDATGSNPRNAWDRKCIFINGMEINRTKESFSHTVYPWMPTGTGYEVVLTGGDNDKQCVAFTFSLADVLASLKPIL
jgi:hypothetical protein